MTKQDAYLSLELDRDGDLRIAEVTGAQIMNECAERSATRNDAPEWDTATVETCIEWMERELDDGVARRYVLLADALKNGVGVSGYGRGVFLTNLEVQEAVQP
jgi:hypothetical protein